MFQILIMYVGIRNLFLSFKEIKHLLASYSPNIWSLTTSIALVDIVRHESGTGISYSKMIPYPIPWGHTNHILINF